MRVICKQNKAYDNYELLVLLNKERPKDIYNDDYYVSERGYYNIGNDIIYDIKIGEEYEVYGIMFFEGKIRYLVMCDNSATPNWIINDMFEITDYKLPYNWYCNNFESNNIKGTIIGYKELVIDYQHLLGLMAQNSKDIKIFSEQKDKIEYFN